MPNQTAIGIKFNLNLCPKNLPDMRVLFVLFSVFFFACKNSSESSSTEKELDSIKQQVVKAYKPGFGEFMSSMQMHHAKLWFAGINGNWELADFELHEITETADAIKEYCTDRTETKMLNEYLPTAMNGLNQAIEQKDQSLFKERFLFLTKSCNDCHKANSFGFNVVTIPTALPVTNQDFKKLN
jgi:hypothetical protein